MQAAGSLFKKAQSFGAAAASSVAQKAGAAKDFVVEAGQIAASKVSGHLLGSSEDPPLSEKLPSGNFCVEIVKAINVPRCDLLSPSDPFVQFYISEDRDGKTYRVSEIFTTSIKQDTDEPVWHHYTNLNCSPPDSSYLSINLYDADFDDNAVLKNKTLLGSTRIPVACISDDTQSYPLELKWQKRGKKEDVSKFSISLRRLFRETKLPNLKTFFLIRHGESKWNQAEESKDIPALVAFDHPLTAKGIQQAKSLCDAWTEMASALKEASSDVPDPEWAKIAISMEDLNAFDEGALREKYIRMFLSADVVCSSPLTRAVQTAMVGMRGHPAMKTSGLMLYSGLREAKGRVGLDSVGICTGEAIMERACTELIKAVDEAAATTAGAAASETGKALADSVKPTAVDVFDCHTPWWRTAAQHDTAADLRKRVDQFLAFARYGGARAPVYVGHSLFFRAVCGAAGGQMEKNRGALLGPMRSAKLDNASLLAVTVEYYPGDTPPVVVDAAVLVGGFRVGKK